MPAWSGGPAHVAYEIVQLFADRLGLETGVDRAAVGSMDRELRLIRTELAKFDQYPENNPPIIDLSRQTLPPEDAALFDNAVEEALGL